MRRPGRPRLDENDPSVDIHVRVPSKLFDALDAEARQQRTTMPDLVRRVLQRRDMSREDDRDDR